MPVANKPLIRGTTSTSGTGAFTVTAVAGSRAFSVLPNGTEVTVTRWDSAGNYEEGRVTVSTSGGVTTLTWVARTDTSAGGTTPVSWAAGGTQNVVLGPLASLTPVITNSLSEYGATAAGLALLQSASAAAQRTALGLDDARVTLSSGQSGGTVGKIVRLSAANTWVDASQADSLDQLAVVAFRESASLYVLRGRIAIASLSAAIPYYLGSAGAVTSSAPTPTSSVRRLMLGVSLNTGELLLSPSMPIGG